jgi:hypothetical protein
MKQLATILVLSLALIAPVGTATDPWDLGAGDDGAATDNELIPGSVQPHDLQSVAGVPDEDWYLVSQKPYSSYEVVVDGVSEAVAIVPPVSFFDTIQVQLVDSSGGNQVVASGISEIGSSRRLRFRNTTSTENRSRFIRVQPSVNGCHDSCTSDAVYRITMRETTMFASRFNNSGTQITVLILQNTHDTTITYTAHFFNGAGTQLISTTATIPAYGSVSINTSTIPQLVGTSGAIIVNHTAPYSALTGKAVALEPATGFSFDTPLVPKLH